MNVNPAVVTASAKDVLCVGANNNCNNYIKHEEKNVVLTLNGKQGEGVHSASITVATIPQKVEDVVQKDHVSIQ